MFVYEPYTIVSINSIIRGRGIIKKRLVMSEVNIYQVKVLEGKYKGEKLWFAEHEISESSTF